VAFLLLFLFMPKIQLTRKSFSPMYIVKSVTKSNEGKGGQNMKRIALSLMIVIVFCGSAFGATLNLKATWTANTEGDMASYKLYRTDGTRTLMGTIPHPTTTYNFSVTVPDNSSGV
jgi:hypothetical protein